MRGAVIVRAPTILPNDLFYTRISNFIKSPILSATRAVWRHNQTKKKNRHGGVLKHLFLEGVDQTKILLKKPGNDLSEALLMSRFEKIRG